MLNRSVRVLRTVISMKDKHTALETFYQINYLIVFAEYYKIQTDLFTQEYLLTNT